MWRQKGVRCMTVKETYPSVKRRRAIRAVVRTVCRWAFLFSAVVCVALNLVLGGKAWSVVVSWSMWLLWSQVISTDLVEFNRISQLIKLVINACILLTLIDVLIAPGWAAEVVPIVCFSGLILVGVLFFANFDRQRQNMWPMLFMSTACLIGAVAGMFVWRGESRWPLVVMGALALALLVGCIARLGRGFGRECAKRFSR
jgi:hypothetical protein